MATITLPGHVAVLTGDGDLADWFPVEFQIVFEGNATTFSYGADGSSRMPLTLQVDGTHLLVRDPDYAPLAASGYETWRSGSFEADIGWFASWFYSAEFYVRLGGDALPDDMPGVLALAERADDPFATQITSGPFVPGAVFDLADLPGATSSDADWIQLDETPTAAGAEAVDIFTGRGADSVWVGSGDDRLRLGDGQDHGAGGAGDDEIRGGSGWDNLHGEDGDDALFGGSHRDWLYGGDGGDRLFGGGRADALFGGTGADRLWGGRGKDELHGEPGNDTLRGGGGRDVLEGAEGADVLGGGAGADRLLGGRGADDLRGDDGRDRLHGGTNADLLDGGRGGDDLRGMGGRDVLVGGQGDDVLRGGRGDDTFVFTGGDDRIADFSLRGRVDTVALAYDRLPRMGEGSDHEDIVAFLRNVAGMSDGDLVLDFGRRGSLTYEGRDMDDLARILNERNLVLMTEAEIVEGYDLHWLR